jgi:HD superfamily phosphohydrolase
VVFTKEEVAFVRLGALLHDLGHLPAGHTLEDELGLLPPHDADERLNLILDRRLWRGVPVEPTLRELIDTRYAKFSDAVARDKLSASDILLSIISKDRKDTRSDLEMLRIGVLRDIIGNTICADLLDYLHRDWLHLGKRRELDTRLLEYLEIRTRTKGTEKTSQLAINLRSGNRVRTDAATGILDLLESRYQLFEIALFHRTKLCAAAMLERMLAELHSARDDGDKSIQGLPELLLDCSDAEMLAQFLRDISSLTPTTPEKKKAAEAARLLVQRLQLRKLHKEFVTTYEYNLANASLTVQDLFIGPREGGEGAKQDALELELQIGSQQCATLRTISACHVDP